ncbi:hypothetical protein C8R45DRAFT_945577 [Mycena sanguinolenta]|nr:hypothetical protein C8R45DRAFT_945577 [Mycena sanguinolenta]
MYMAIVSIAFAIALPTATAWNRSVTLLHLPRHLAWSVDSCIGGACLHVLFPSRFPSLLDGAGSSALELHMYQHASSVVEGVYTIPTGLNCLFHSLFLFNGGGVEDGSVYIVLKLNVVDVHQVTYYPLYLYTVLNIHHFLIQLEFENAFGCDKLL